MSAAPSEGLACTTFFYSTPAALPSRAGLDAIVIAYCNQDRDLVSEVLRFSGDLVVERHGTTWCPASKAYFHANNGCSN
ncbi:hypothetical protein [Mycobacterium vicinigordonae]|uniref:Uncharacterized protein n=1 Tax=Mycobacterium vicinigordonae TaxID=1719132 RepID=A0A7D6E189_9MYCO|nr:hypothetical protein [Mycobacterium vicinigordonae]QLL05042.1 hypothetical protein H0P51_00895 [Mycobacterium vicinigordonae]